MTTRVDKEYEVGSVQSISTGGGVTASGKVLARRCWQCRKHSVVRYESRFGPTEDCLNNCGPEELGRLLSL